MSPPGPGSSRQFAGYLVVTFCYWVFTLSDGALRMLLLLFLHEQGHSPLEIALLFVFYEFFGVLTNLYGGQLGTRVGLKLPLLLGLGLQSFALLALAGVAAQISLGVVMVAQALSGIAKDFTKMSAKSYVKYLAVDGDREGLLRWVSWLTGSKNALKGAGFFLGAVLSETLGFPMTCVAMASVLAVVTGIAFFGLAKAPGKSGKSPRRLFSTTPAINGLAAARLLLFASRDAWFVLALPVYLASELGWGHRTVGAALALWVIFYGMIQASAPRFLGQDHRQLLALPKWAFLLVLPLAGVAVALSVGLDPGISVVVGLGVFALIFATNSASHSYLVVALAERGTVAKDVGFYYAANAVGRLLGTVISGAVFQMAGLGTSGLLACFAVAALLALGAGFSSLPLRRLAPTASP